MTALEEAVAARDPSLLTVPQVVKMVADAYGLPPERLLSRSRASEVLRPRQAAMYLARRYTHATLSEIGRAFNRAHPSVANAIRRVEAIR